MVGLGVARNESVCLSVPAGKINDMILNMIVFAIAIDIEVYLSTARVNFLNYCFRRYKSWPKPPWDPC